MKTLSIEIPENHVIDKLDKRTGKITFKLKSTDVTERINDFNDVLNELNIKKKKFLKSLNKLSSDEAAYRKLKLIVKAYNEGKEVDFGNSNQHKYYPRFYFDASSGWSFYDIDLWNSYTGCGARLCFLERKHAEDAASKFMDVYKDFL